MMIGDNRFQRQQIRRAPLPHMMTPLPVRGMVPAYARPSQMFRPLPGPPAGAPPVLAPTPAAAPTAPWWGNRGRGEELQRLRRIEMQQRQMIEAQRLQQQTAIATQAPVVAATPAPVIPQAPVAPPMAPYTPPASTDHDLTPAQDAGDNAAAAASAPAEEHTTHGKLILIGVAVLAAGIGTAVYIKRRKKHGKGGFPHRTKHSSGER